jgi:hypothetical protein
MISRGQYQGVQGRQQLLRLLFNASAIVLFTNLQILKIFQDKAA